MIWLLILGTLGLSLWASTRVQSSYEHFSQIPASSGMTGAQAAEMILRLAGVRGVEIAPQAGRLIDHYDPLRRRLVLSTENFYGRSLAALGIAAHEAGHAIQHANSYIPLHLRMAAVGVTNFASSIVTWLPLIGMFTGLLATSTALWVLALGWGVIMAFNLITLPVEFDASARAKRLLLQSGLVASGSEVRGVSQMLRAAGWTYVAAFLTSLGYFLWHLLPLLGTHAEEH